MQPLVEADELAEVLEDVVICDMRWDLTDAGRGRSTYERGHIPGAVFVDLDTDLAAPQGVAGRHPLPSVADFASTLGRLGVSPGTRVIVYDDVAGRIGARMWWMLRSIGHEEAQVLNGGYQAWVATGRDIEVGMVVPQPRPYSTPTGFTGVTTHVGLAGRVLIDARAGDRYRGENEPVDPKAGHIPGAINISTVRNLDEEGRFLKPADLAEVYGEVGSEAVVSCGSGVTACHDALAMVVAGLPMPDVYVGSFSEWSRLDLPVSTGPSP